jgi:hypothetical protein
MELWGEDVGLRGAVSPVFYTRAGERVVLPNDFQDAATRITAAVCCLGCRHCHLLGPRLTAADRTENPNTCGSSSSSENCFPLTGSPTTSLSDPRASD